MRSDWNDRCVYSWTLWILFYCCCSVTESCPSLFGPMDYGTPGFPLLHCLLEFAQVHVLWVSDACLTIPSTAAHFSCLQSFPASGSFPVSWLFASGGQSIGTSASASVLPMNSQGWFPLGLTGPISSKSKGLSGVFSRTAVWKHRFFIFVLLFISQHLKSTGCFQVGYFCPEKRL